MLAVVNLWNGDSRPIRLVPGEKPTPWLGRALVLAGVFLAIYLVVALVFLKG